MPRPDGLSLPSFAGRPSLRDQVGSAIRSAIIAGEMKPGERYSAPELATRFGVSATPVREAMLDLVNQGLVVVVRNKGFEVTDISDEDLEQITQIRALVEPPMSAAAVATISDSELGVLRDIAQQIVDAAAEANLIEYLAADRQFHTRLLAATGNHRLVRIVDELRAQTRLYGLSELARDGRLVASAKEHLQICDLIGARDAGAVEHVMRVHISRVRAEWAGPRPE